MRIQDDVSRMSRKSLEHEVRSLRGTVIPIEDDTTLEPSGLDLPRQAPHTNQDTLVSIAVCNERADAAARVQRQLDEAFYQAISNVYVAQGVMQVLIKAPLFPGTAQLLSNANGELGKHIDGLENKLAEFKRLPGVTISDSPLLTEFFDSARDLRDSVKLLLVSKRITNEKLAALCEWVVRDYNPQIAALFEGVTSSRPGAPSEPTPITKLILTGTAKVKGVHGLRTRGEQMETYLEELKQRKDVQAWQRVKVLWQNERDPTKRKETNINEKLKKQSVEVQAVDRYEGMTRSQLNDVLEEMQDNNRAWISKQGG